MVGRRAVVLSSVSVAAVAASAWVVLGTPGLGGGGHGKDVLVQAPQPAATGLPSPSPTPTARPTPSPSPSPTASPTPSPRPSPVGPATPSPTLSPTPSPHAQDVGTGAYASVLPRLGYGFCPCDTASFRQPAPVPGLALTCAAPGTLQPGRLVPITLTVKNTTSGELSFRELAGPRFVYLELATDPGRVKDQNGGFADNAGHTSAADGWWAGDSSSSVYAYRAAAGTVSHVVPAHGSLTLTVYGATVRTKDATPLQAGSYNLEAGFVLDAQADAWTCPAVHASIG